MIQLLANVSPDTQPARARVTSNSNSNSPPQQHENGAAAARRVPQLQIVDQGNQPQPPPRSLPQKFTAAAASSVNDGIPLAVTFTTDGVLGILFKKGSTAPLTIQKVSEMLCYNDHGSLYLQRWTLRSQ